MTKQVNKNSPISVANRNLVQLQRKIDKGLKSIAKNLKNIPIIDLVDDEDAMVAQNNQILLVPPTNTTVHRYQNLVSFNSVNV